MMAVEKATMASLNQRQFDRLSAMGIDVWVSRAGAGGADEPRVRLSSGEGSWLLVQRQPWRGQFESLLSDVTATIGVAECRFGQWANSQDAGVGLSELAGRGIRCLVSFGPLPPSENEASLIASGTRVIEVPTMQAIYDEPSARQALWQGLRLGL